MGRKPATPRDFAGRIEQLEDRRVMSAEPAGDLLGAIGNYGFEEQTPPPVVAPVIDPVATEPDFWIDQAALEAYNHYFDQVEQALADAHKQSGWLAAQNKYGYTGLGQTVAVIDSGIAYDHFALGGGFGANYRVVGGWDFAENDANPYDDGGAGGHGTHVSGIIGNNSSSHSGVAPGVDLVSLRVFNDAGQGFFTWVEQALRWVYNNRNAFENPITTVNLSLGVSSWNSETIPNWASLEDEFALLKSAGIFIAVSAGNSYATYKTPGLSYPAASQYVVPVMSTDDGGYLSSYSQRLDRAIAAPGRGITSTVPDYKGNNNGKADDFASMSGTSMAAPYVAAASVLIREAMQSIGMTNITQDTIYEHMLATADTIYDGLSKLSYKRLNLEKALDALAPSDDHGSSIGTATDLGTLSGSTSVSGAIGASGDVDFFRFTAGSTGNVTVKVTSATGAMAPAWTAYDAAGNEIGSANGDVLTFAVTAGETFSLKLASTGGTGGYSFEASLKAAVSYEDWGVVSWNQLNGVGVNGEQWYRVAATQDGVLTVYGAVQSGAGGVKLDVYNASKQLIGTSTSAGGVIRVDANAAAGEEYFVKVVAHGASVDFTLANIVSQDGATVTISGTESDDAFQFNGGLSSSEVIVNGLKYTFASSAASRFVIHGGGGNDAVVLRGSAGNDVATLSVGSASLVGAGYDASVDGVEEIEAYGGGGLDRSILHDSAGHDEFRAWADKAQLRGKGFTLYAYGFDEYQAVSSGGYDRAYFYDTAGDDVFEARPDRATMVADSFKAIAEGFDLAWAFASTGFDTATLYDSSGNDEYTSWADRAQMIGPDYSAYANGFDRYEGVSTTGDDRAVLNDSAGHDLFRAYADRSLMKTGESTSTAVGFRQTTGVATNGGFDRAVFYDTVYDDVVEVRSWGVALTSPGVRNEARGFAYNAAISTVGDDVIDADAVDFAFESVGAWK